MLILDTPHADGGIAMQTANALVFSEIDKYPVSGFHRRQGDGVRGAGAKMPCGLKDGVVGPVNSRSPATGGVISRRVSESARRLICERVATGTANSMVMRSGTSFS